MVSLARRRLRHCASSTECRWPVAIVVSRLFVCERKNEEATHGVIERNLMIKGSEIICPYEDGIIVDVSCHNLSDVRETDRGGISAREIVDVHCVGDETSTLLVWLIDGENM